MIRFKEVELVEKVKKNKKDYSLADELKALYFIHSAGDTFLVEDDWYNNNNDLRRAIQTEIKQWSLPLEVFMFGGNTYVRVL